MGTPPALTPLDQMRNVHRIAGRVFEMTTFAGARPNCAGSMAIGAATKLAETPMSPINSTFASVCFAAGTGAGSLFTDRAQQHLLAQHPI
jgi:hypothetical protein